MSNGEPRTVETRERVAVVVVVLSASSMQELSAKSERHFEEFSLPRLAISVATSAVSAVVVIILVAGRFHFEFFTATVRGAATRSIPSGGDDVSVNLSSIGGPRFRTEKRRDDANDAQR